MFDVRSASSRERRSGRVGARAPRSLALFPAMIAATAVVGCSRTGDAPTAPAALARSAPCASSGVVTLGVAQGTVADCTNGGVTVTLAGSGSRYLVVAQFPTGQAPAQLVTYTLSTLGPAASSAGDRAPAMQWPAAGAGAAPATGGPAAFIPTRQRAVDHLLLARARAIAQSPSFSQASRSSAPAASLAPPAVGSTRSFHVLSSFDAAHPAWKSVTARLDYVGGSVLVYQDVAAPSGGFTAAQLQQYGQYFDRTLYPIDTTAFGQPSDIDRNGRVIMLLSPVVNAGVPAATCYSQGYVAGFFNAEDFNGGADPNSNQGEIFYSIVPDPSGQFSCAHNVSDVDAEVPVVFLHEMQHLINFSQHTIVSHGQPGASWMDEGLSLVAEELGSAYYEARCPPPACRTDPAQLLPDSAVAFARGFMLDSYDYATLPDTVSLTLQNDGQFGLAWRGGDWALMRWLGDQMGSEFYRKLETGPADGIADIEAATGQPFAALFANFGLALFTDSLPGLPRTIAPPVDRFASRNLRALWSSALSTWGAGGGTLPFPIPVRPISAGATVQEMAPGAMSFWRLDTPASASAITVRFAAPGGAPLPGSLHPQLAIFRLPPGQ